MPITQIHDAPVADDGIDPQLAHGSSRWVALPLLGFLYMLVRPVSNGAILLPVLAALACFGALSFLIGRPRRSVGRPLIILAMIEFGFGLLFSLLGDGNPGRLDQFQTFVGFPVVFWLIVIGITEDILRRVLLVLAIGCAAIGTAIILYVGNQQGVLPQIIPRSLLAGQGGAYYVSTAESGVGIQLFALATLVAGAPLWVASLLVPNSRLMPPLWLRTLAATACSVAALIAGRRAIVVTIIMAPLLVWLISGVLGRAGADKLMMTPHARRRAKQRRLRLIAIVIGGILLVGRYAFTGSTLSANTLIRSLRALLTTFLGNTPNDADDLVRFDESNRLLQGWHQQPLFGHGLGATIPFYARSASKPWDFELQYHMLLFDTGLLGLIFAVSAAVCTIYAARQAVRLRPDLAGTLVVASVGTVSLLAAAESNPYLQAPGYYWGLFLSISVINVMLTCPLRPPPRRSEVRDDTPPPLGRNPELSWSKSRYAVRG